ncbi:sodium:proton antiporter [Verrucomicrobiaceae bacterium R5-34]|uniref:Sodium:proton antiporter n=1 Tax=Oceaniferula flava TaxID=2800421 RepID=A0AAE2SDI1_9BACT|nr:sodium:proton antiporter [Oceaniferula flavus]MBK1830283.1 sodium:proton antiporter [Verrucomicrobiaceae bacterium R5-34]MBK1854874.1 sodium:proton antiporter [Oceaniferula flavus]MBM1136180.1 sodium:proton antiporter [Oceaniferula flavus]
MEFLDITAILLSLAALFSYVNYRWIKLPTTIGIMLIGLAMSLIFIGIGQFSPDLTEAVDEFVTRIDFNKALMNGMLSYLLFAGALHVNLNELKKQARIVSIMASLGVVVSTFLIGAVSYFLFQAFGLGIPWIWCLVFGALISPTDPVAVLGILKTAGAPKSLETKITGESLFNDGVGVVVYIALLGIAGFGPDAGHGHEPGDIAMLFLKEAGGGLLLGGVLGYGCYRLLKSIDHYHVEVLLTLALVTAGYRLAMSLHISGPLAMVVAGLMIGNHGREDAMSEKTRLQIDTFWELIDEILNALLFLLIGLEIFVLDFSTPVLIAGLVLIPVTLLARYVAVSIPITLLRPWRTFTTGSAKILTWGGLRGGISVALALAIPTSQGEIRDVILLATYVIVIFSISVQGLSLKSLVAKTLARNAERDAG